MNDAPLAPGPWADRAACKGRGAEMTLPVGGGSTGAGAGAIAERAKQICAGCPVLVECRTWATSVPDPAVDMIAGGLAPWERRGPVGVRRDAYRHDRCHVEPCTECAAIVEVATVGRIEVYHGGPQHGSRAMARSGCDCGPCAARRLMIARQNTLRSRRHRGQLRVVAS